MGMTEKTGRHNRMFMFTGKMVSCPLRRQAFRSCLKRMIVCGLPGLWAVLLLSGCTPEEKTVVLPGEETQAAEGEEAWDGEGFSVKKIYTFSYETAAALERSAFIKGCGENEIRVIAREDEEEGSRLAGREVDYRYGFYQTEGDFWVPCEDGSDGQTGDDASYIGKMIPSPDGRQILTYSFSPFSDYSAVKLYQMGAWEPWLLYEGEGGVGRSSKGAFTSDGRWMTFDVTGFRMGEKTVVPVYDSLKTPNQQKIVHSNSAQLYPPDLALQAWTSKNSELWEAQLYDFFGEVGRIGIDSSDGRLMFVEDFPGNQNSYYLAGGNGASPAYLQYELAEEENRLYYLVEDMQLWYLDLTQGTYGEPIVFREPILDFLRLETGEILALAVPNSGEARAGSGDYVVNTEPIREADSRLMMIQKFWSIRSVDLYLYPPEGGEGELLYKGIRDLVFMEYDQENGRILLETWEEGEPVRRKCLILELK